MKITKPLLEDCKCQFENCTEKAVCKVYGRKVCRLHYVITKLSAREKRKNGEDK